jgi:NADP-dependent 3-hydroxy acid dehydrogenase YdfG
MPHSPLERLKVDDWDRMIDVNIEGVPVAPELPMKSEMLQLS